MVNIYVNNIACYGPRYICKCQRLDKVRYENSFLVINSISKRNFVSPRSRVFQCLSSISNIRR